MTTGASERRKKAHKGTAPDQGKPPLRLRRCPRGHRGGRGLDARAPAHSPHKMGTARPPFRERVRANRVPYSSVCLNHGQIGGPRFARTRSLKGARLRGDEAAPRLLPRQDVAASHRLCRGSRSAPHRLSAQGPDLQPGTCFARPAFVPCGLCPHRKRPRGLGLARAVRDSAALELAKPLSVHSRFGGPPEASRSGRPSPSMPGAAAGHQTSPRPHARVALARQLVTRSPPDRSPHQPAPHARADGLRPKRAWRPDACQ